MTLLIQYTVFIRQKTPRDNILTQEQSSPVTTRHYVLALLYNMYKTKDVMGQHSRAGAAYSPVTTRDEYLVPMQEGGGYLTPL